MKSLKISLAVLSLVFATGSFAQDLSKAKPVNAKVKTVPTQKQHREKLAQPVKPSGDAKSQDVIDPKKSENSKKATK